MLHSEYQDLGSVTLPMWQGRQKYMHTFDLAAPIMPPGFEDYMTIVRQLTGNHTARLAHMTVDEKVIEPGMSQRKPDAHVDGCFMEDHWGHDGPGWAHYCNRIPFDRMAVIVASDVPGCMVYPGEFDGTPRNDGDLEHIRDQLGGGELLCANRGYLLSPDCVHESMRFHIATRRIFLRIALPSLN